jgi:hypothetical protein
MSDVVFRANNVMVRNFSLCSDETTLVYRYVTVCSTKFENKYFFSYFFIFATAPELVTG